MGVAVKGLRKSYGGGDVLGGVTFAVPDGKLATILGPSGSGKTTLLICIAGVEIPDEGSITIGERVVFDHATGVNLPPEDRGIGMVFQSNALWPHMTVRQNISYPLEVRKDKGAAPKVKGVLALLKIDSLAERYPSEISGGEQQRVAIARAIVYDPSLVLLDEPFSSLDVPLRESLRDELRQLQLKLGATMLYVTHERVDALSLGDLTVVISDGMVVAIGTPSSLVTDPPNSYTAKFVAGMLSVDGSSTASQGGVMVETEFGRFDVPGKSVPIGKVKLCIPSGAIWLPDIGSGPIPGTVTGTVVRPSGVFGVRVATGAGVAELTLHGSHPRLVPGDRVGLSFDPAKCLVLLE